MAEPSSTETLNPPSDSTQPATMNALDISDQVPQEPSNAELTEEIQSGEKRKRVDPEPESPKQNSEERHGSVHPLWKTSLCSYFRRSEGACSHGATCRYAHGEDELRPRPDNTWDPTSERAKKMLKSENGEGLKASRDTDQVLMTEAFAEDSSSEAGLSKCLVNLPMKWSSDNLRTFLGEQGVLYKSAKKKKGMSVGFVSFENADQEKTAKEELDGKSVGNKNLKVADVIPRSFDNKNKVALPSLQNTLQNQESTSADDDRHAPECSNGVEDSNPVNDDLISGNAILRGRTVRDAVTPLAHLPYADQLEQKKNSLIQTLKRLTRNARKACPNGVSLPEWILKSREIGGLPCKLEGILQSPLVNGYRNKCEFSVGYSLQGKPTVGFLLGNFREGVTAVEEPVDCPNVSRIACKYAAIFQEFIRHSDLPIWNRLNNTGFWRQLTVREGRMPGKVDEVEKLEANVSQVMLMVQVCTTGLDDEKEKSEFERMAQAFVDGALLNSPPLPLTALVVQDHKGISNAAPADAPLLSLPILKAGSHSELEPASDVVEARIHDYISNLKFCISPTAFFQVNTLAAEKLYALAGDWAGLGPDTLLFDICCGTGTIGLTLAHRVGMVVGIEMNASAVSDAQRNAEINGITNCRFVCSKAEDVMGSLLKEYLKLLDKSSDESDQNDEEIIAAEGNGTPIEAKPDLEDSSAVEIESYEGVSRSAENCSQKLEEKLKKGDKSENGTPVGRKFKNVVAIVDPPRVGLHPTVIKSLRTHPMLRRLVYISCNPESLVANAIELCTPSADKTEKGNNKNNRGWRNMSSAGLARHRTKSMPNSEPFRPVKAMAVDLFPHTPHCELVMLLER